ncbi:hypothetical protein L3Y34_005423 [Caenorhabditis briggsae]|uniref:Uncharacterized protein n=1 Tax=Caenorhabditis briggsae TaxID=6238 RepID=A0AAE9AHQ0_CAEBR|nr:hypothetical protein L3Y34_005423 [Caenorhabditis briggsae]
MVLGSQKISIDLTSSESLQNSSSFDVESSGPSSDSDKDFQGYSAHTSANSDNLMLAAENRRLLNPRRLLKPQNLTSQIPMVQWLKASLVATSSSDVLHLTSPEAAWWWVESVETWRRIQMTSLTAVVTTTTTASSDSDSDEQSAIEQCVVATTAR